MAKEIGMDTPLGRASPHARRVVGEWVELLSRRISQSPTSGLVGVAVELYRRQSTHLGMARAHLYPQVDKNLPKYIAMIKRWKGVPQRDILTYRPKIGQNDIIADMVMMHDRDENADVIMIGRKRSSTTPWTPSTRSSLPISDLFNRRSGTSSSTMTDVTL